MGVTIMWQDGLPDDPLERASIEQTLQSAGLTSVYSSLMRINGGDSVAAHEEWNRILEEERRNALTGAAKLQQGEDTPQRGELFKSFAERGMKGTSAT